MIVNAENLVAGRLASKLAKKIIQGETITVINANKTVIVGTKKAIMPKFKQRIDAAVKSNPHYGPKYNRIPSRILRKMIKGMLPNKKRTSERLIKQVKIFNEVPIGIDVSKTETIKSIKCNEKHDFMYLDEVAKALGGKW